MLSRTRVIYNARTLYALRYEDINIKHVLRMYRALVRLRGGTQKTSRSAALACALQLRNYDVLIALAYTPLSPRACYDYVAEAQHIAHALALL